MMTKETLKSFTGRLLRYEKARFALVGVLNTAVDFSILFILVHFAHTPTIIANIISTSIALSVSFLLNKRSVFGNTEAHTPKQIILFVVVTLSGLWILQSIVIYSVTAWLQQVLPQNVVLLVAKLIATLFSLTWNYLWYSRVVFASGASRK